MEILLNLVKLSSNPLKESPMMTTPVYHSHPLGVTIWPCRREAVEDVTEKHADHRQISPLHVYLATIRPILTSKMQIRRNMYGFMFKQCAEIKQLIPNSTVHCDNSSSHLLCGHCMETVVVHPF